MFDKFKQLADLKKMRDQAMQMQRQLDEEVIDFEKNGVRIKITAAQKLISMETNDKDDKEVMQAVNEAVKESQKVAAKRMQKMVGFEGLKGLFGQ